jgi:calcineurin-like phosphoesterase family protein
MGKTFIIADLRLFNEDIANQMGYADFESMNSEVIRSWNSGVKPDDDVIIMGDIGDASVE